MTVVKVGGSLFDHPKLGAGLRAYLESLAPAEVLLVPGGGGVADAVRELDRVHALGGEAAHWLALRSLGVTVRKSVDMLLGAFCIERGHVLLHDDRDFDPMEQHLGLRVVAVP